MLACMEVSSEITIPFYINSFRRQFELGMALCCISYYFVYTLEYLLSRAGCYYLWKAETGRKDRKLWWINECLEHGQNINILCTKLGWPSWAQLIKLICIHEDVNFQWKTGRDANKFWEKEIILYRFFLRHLRCPRSNPSWKDNYFLLWFIFEDCLS